MQVFNVPIYLPFGVCVCVCIYTYACICMWMSTFTSSDLFLIIPSITVDLAGETGSLTALGTFWIIESVESPAAVELPATLFPQCDDHRQASLTPTALLNFQIGYWVWNMGPPAHVTITLLVNPSPSFFLLILQTFFGLG